MGYHGCKLIRMVLLLASSAAVAQQPFPDAAKIAPVYQQQRNAEADGRAVCVAIVGDLQARIADLERQLTDAKAAAGVGK